MLIQIGMIAAAYLGAKLYEKYKEKKQLEQAVKSVTDETQDVHCKLLSDPRTEPVPANQMESCEHYKDMSLLTMGLFGLRYIFPFLGPAGMLCYLYTVIPYMKDVEKTLLRDRKVNVDVLFLLSDFLALMVGQYLAAGFGLYLRHLAILIVERTKDHSQKMVMSVFGELPQKVWVLLNDAEVEIPLSHIRKDDILIVRAGEIIPADGFITEGMASIDQQALTGEAQPAEKGAGDYVYANTIVIAGRIHIKVESSGYDTEASKIADILLYSTSFKSEIQLKGEKWANKATSPMLVTAGLVLPIFGPQSAAVFINSHMGNRIRVLAPLGTLKHVAMAAQNHILIKDGRALEALCKVDTVLFDKTGTLTTGEPEVTRIHSCSHYSEHEILGLAATAEAKLTHPIAEAILRQAENMHLTPQDILDSEYRIGYGITVSIGGKVVRVGSIRFITGEGIAVPEKIRDIMANSDKSGNTFILVTADARVAGAIELQAKVRPEAKKTIDQLRNRGITHFAVVSGDHEQPTRKLAEELGADEYFYNILPEEKARIVEQLQEKNRIVCFVGDGINDAIAMKKADVSISLAGAATIATDMAEIILTDGTLVNLCDLFDISKKLDKNLKKSLKLSIAPGIINVAGAFVFHFNIMTSLVVSVLFAGIAMYDVMKPEVNTHKKIEQTFADAGTSGRP